MPAIFKIVLSACPAARAERDGRYSAITSYPFSGTSRVVEVTGGKHLAEGMRLAIARFGADVLEANPGRSFIVSALVRRPNRKPPGFDALLHDLGGSFNQWLRTGEGPWFTSENLREPAAPQPVVAEPPRRGVVGAAAAVVALLVLLAGGGEALARGVPGGAKAECVADARTLCADAAGGPQGPKAEPPPGTYRRERRT